MARRSRKALTKSSLPRSDEPKIFRTFRSRSTAIEHEDLEALGWQQLTEVPSQVPNMQMSAPYGSALPLFAIRGVSMLDYTPSQASPIGVYLDEVR